ncbi:MAG: M20/M25/M40 family metallo-hydrolase [Proteobacteria bacterium]|nr:M20/M25/M40 family metallo-hydrolase [Pseudomonadota bacterium]
MPTDPASALPQAATRFADATHAAMPVARELFETIGAATGDGVGMAREPYSENEQKASDLLEARACDLGLEILKDAFGNLYMTLPGADRSAPGWITGSHIDSVPSGGNFDGLAGVVAGLAAVAALRAAGIVPATDITVMGVRAEEASAWYAGAHGGHIGSRSALGILPPAELDSAINTRSGRPLRAHMADAGCCTSNRGRCWSGSACRWAWSRRSAVRPAHAAAAAPAPTPTRARCPMNTAAMRCWPPSSSCT